MKRTRAGFLSAITMFAVTFAATAAGAQTIDLELNRLDEIDGQCAASLLFTNRLGQTLDRVRFDVYVMGDDGVIVRRLFLDTGPMRDGKTTVATFAVLDRPCAAVGRLLVNDVPVCKTEAGVDVDCVAALNPTSRAGVELAK